MTMTYDGGGAGGVGETRRRAIVKAITYRVIVAITLAAISWFYTGNLFETSALYRLSHVVYDAPPFPSFNHILNASSPALLR